MRKTVTTITCDMCGVVQEDQAPDRRAFIPFPFYWKGMPKELLEMEEVCKACIQAIRDECEPYGPLAQKATLKAIERRKNPDPVEAEDDVLYPVPGWQFAGVEMLGSNDVGRTLWQRLVNWLLS